MLEIRSNLPKGEAKVGLSKAKGAILRIRIAAPDDVFPDTKTAPTSNLARPPSLLSMSEGNNPQVDPASLPPTPLHSTALHLASLSLLTYHLRYHHSLSTAYPAYTASVRLLQAWATLRGYAASLGFTSDWWAWCVARSLNAGGKVVGGDTASLAAGGEGWAGWRKTIEWLSMANWTEGIWFKSADEKVRFASLPWQQPSYSAHSCLPHYTVLEGRVQAGFLRQAALRRSKRDGESCSRNRALDPRNGPCKSTISLSHLVVCSLSN